MNPQIHEGADETILFRASNENSLWDFLKTEIAKDKCIECHFPFLRKDALLSMDLIRRGVHWIKFTNTEKLYPPDFKPNCISIRDAKELKQVLSGPLIAKHFYCKFEQSELTFQHKRLLNQAQITSVSFSDGHTIYAPF